MASDPGLILFGICISPFAFFFISIFCQQTLAVKYPLVVKICHHLGLTCCALHEEQDEPDTWQNESYTLVSYQFRPPDLQTEIDKFRNVLIVECLSTFSLILEEEHMVALRCQSLENHSKIGSAQSTSEHKEDYLGTEDKRFDHSGMKTVTNESRTCEISPNLEEKQAELEDIEKGIEREESKVLNTLMEAATPHAIMPISSPDPTADNDLRKEVIESSQKKNTHILIPRPGRGIKCANICQNAEVINNVEGSEFCVNSKHRSIFNRFQDIKTKEEEKEVKADDDLEDADEDSNAKRSVPIFCAICLNEYELSDKICWSSNPDCTHVFHHGCMVKWLVSLGRRKSQIPLPKMAPSYEQLLSYPLDCPCCRQDFILKPLPSQACDVGEVDTSNITDEQSLSSLQRE